MSEKIEIIGTIVKDPYGSWEDCSPGLYIQGEDGSEEFIAGNNGYSFLGKYENKRVKITVEVLPSISDIDEDEPTINLTFSQIMDKGAWQKFCEWKGINEWCINEGRADGSERTEVTISKAKELGLI